MRFLLSPKDKPFQPVFLIGCGRSGTTILGETIGRHDAVTYLNEARDLWHRAYPEFDVWSGRTAHPKLVAGEGDDEEIRTRLLRRLFYREQIVGRGSILLEKLPINAFRLEFLASAFPEARFIHLHRNGLEVARSIEKFANARGWFGEAGSKWKLLSRRSMELGGPTMTVESSNFDKGLLEWRMSVELAESFFAKLPRDRFYSLSYQTLTRDAQLQIGNIYRFLGVDCSHEFSMQLASTIERKRGPVRDIDDRHARIGGPKLRLSVENALGQTSPDSVYEIEATR